MEIIVQPLSKQQASARWAELCQEPTLAELEGRFEMDEYGEIRMTPPPSLRHQLVADAIAAQIRTPLRGKAIVECPVYAGKVYVAAIAWIPPEALTSDVGAAVVAPPLVIEVRSPGNPSAGLAAKAQAYLAHGVQEVALVQLDGTIQHITAQGGEAESSFDLTLVVPDELKER